MNQLMSTFSIFKFPILILVLGLGVAGVVGGARQALVVAILAVLEVSLSFDNAVINATILRRMNLYWQKIFITVGILIAVVGMRLLFPIVIVSLTAGLSFGKVVNLVLYHPSLYGQKLEYAHPAIAAFGGVFLLMIFLDFLLDERKNIHWITVLERPLAQSGRQKTLSTLLGLIALVVAATTSPSAVSGRVLSSGVIGLIAYLGVRGFSQLFEHAGGIDIAKDHTQGRSGVTALAGRAALSLFIYLEVLDASFSFDGVVGAFAITSNVLTIMIGLGIGSVFVRQLTIWLVRHDTLRQFIYLEHGAHYAVGALAVLLALSLTYAIPEVVTGLVGVVFIGLSLASSFRVRNSIRLR
jgi:hypothetical protein